MIYYFTVRIKEHNMGIKQVCLSRGFKEGQFSFIQPVLFGDIVSGSFCS